MELAEALTLAQNYISGNLEPPEGDRYEIVESAILETESGWYFPYQTEKYIETRDIEYSVVGNWPIYVTKSGTCLGPTRPAISK